MRDKNNTRDMREKPLSKKGDKITAGNCGIVVVEEFIGLGTAKGLKNIVITETWWQTDASKQPNNRVISRKTNITLFNKLT